MALGSKMRREVEVETWPLVRVDPDLLGTSPSSARLQKGCLAGERGVCCGPIQFTLCVGIVRMSKALPVVQRRRSLSKSLWRAALWTTKGRVMYDDTDMAQMLPG